MLYKKNLTPGIDPEVFKNPTSEYRAAPFWAWNTKLREDELRRQIGIFNEMGFGGFHMHSRAGMGTVYLGPEFMSLVRACTDEAKKKGMLAWLYDEDRWPSGSAGGYVTKNPAYRSKHILFTTHPIAEAVDPDRGHAEGLPYLLAIFDVCLDGEGYMTDYRMINEGDEVCGCKWYIYVKTPEPTGWYNGQTYVDTLCPEAMAEFIRITYEGYKAAVGEEFGKNIHAIFTDEPQFTRKSEAGFGLDMSETKFPWTRDFADTYRETYGEDIVSHLPELRWERADGVCSQARYRYHDHVCERFTQAFSDQCGAWCDANGIALTGHMMEEPSLNSQTRALGEAMRGYRGMGIPGIDMLCNCTEYTTAKQTQSAVHQYGREGMISELYGVTGYTFDFRGHKFQGDWQAALGVSIRVPHLSWVSMKGSAKRDYPASFNYQAPWYKEYRIMEDHFSRVNAVLTRGRPVVRVGVIHPIESYWLRLGPRDQTQTDRDTMQKDFFDLTERLLFGTVDFDFISESLLPDRYKASAAPTLNVGAMAYDAIVVPQLLTMRRTTLDILTEYADRGGKLIFIGDAPEYIDAALSKDALKLYNSSVKVSSASGALLDALSDQREITILDASGSPTTSYLYQMREEEGQRYLFVARGREEKNVDVATASDYVLRMRGSYIPTLLDTSDGEEKPLSYYRREGDTFINCCLGISDSLLIRFAPTNEADTQVVLPACDKGTPTKDIDFKGSVEYSREEPNCLLLDIAEWSEDGEHFAPAEEILRIDKAIRKIYGYSMVNGFDVQPWVIPESPTEHFPYLRFTFDSEIEVPLTLAFEELTGIDFNGESVPVDINGWYVDRDIKTVSLPKSKIGRNVLTLRVPIAPRVSIEAFYLLGDFDVKLVGCEKTLVAPGKKLGFGSVVPQGMPFYGGSITYKTEFELDEEAEVELRISKYRGAMMRVFLDGRDMGELIYSPYIKELGLLSAGVHSMEIKLYGNRQNTFGPLHNANPGLSWIGPDAWYAKNEKFSYDYNTSPFGILNSPVLTVYKK